MDSRLDLPPPIVEGVYARPDWAGYEVSLERLRDSRSVTHMGARTPLADAHYALTVAIASWALGDLCGRD